MDVLSHNPRYEFVDTLGQGANGKVVLARDRLTGNELVAIKLLPKHKFSDYVKREVICHRGLGKHPFVAQFKEAFLTPTHFCIVMEYVNGTTLLAWMQKSGVLDESAARTLFQQVIIAVDYIHRKGVIHRDLKLENTVVVDFVDPSSNRRVVQPKLIDFGFARGEWDSAPRSIVGTITYVAPEVLKCGNRRPYDGKADVWSLGVMLYELVLARNPFVAPHELNTNQQQLTVMVQNRIVSGEFQVPDPPTLSAGCSNLLKRMLQANPAERISIQDILTDAWFREDIPLHVDISAFNSNLVLHTEFADMQTLDLLRQLCDQAATEANTAPGDLPYDPYDDLIDHETAHAMASTGNQLAAGS